MSDDGGLPDPGQRTTDVSAPSTRGLTPRRAEPDGVDDVRTQDGWPDPGQESAPASHERRTRRRE